MKSERTLKDMGVNSYTKDYKPLKYKPICGECFTKKERNEVLPFGFNWLCLDCLDKIQKENVEK